jgi:hypothetical protein
MAGYKYGAPASQMGAVPWLPMFSTVELADFDRLDNYITAVQDHGGGEMTLTVDTTQTRGFPGNGDLLQLDLGAAIKTAGSQTHIVEFRVTFVTRPTDVSGSPYVAIYHTEGVGSRVAQGAVVGLMLAASDSARLLPDLASLLTTSTLIGEIASWNVHFVHANGGIMAVNRYAVIFDGHGGTDPNQRWVQALITGNAPDAANIEVGYDQAGGQVFGLAFTQLSSPGAGSDTFRLKCEYRIIPLSPAA